MLIPQLITQLLAAETHHSAGYLSADGTLAVALCRMGADDERVVSGTLGELLTLASPTAEEAAREEEADEDEAASELELDKRRVERAERRAVRAFGSPLHSLVLVGKRLHHLEAQYAGLFKVEGSRWDEVVKEVYGCAE